MLKIKKQKRRNRNKPSKIRVLLIVILILIVSASGSFTCLSVQQQINQNQQIEEARLALIAAEAAREVKRNEPVYISLPGAQPIRAIVDDYALPSSIWAIVNKTTPIPIDYAPTSIAIPNVETLTNKSDNERSVRRDIIEPLENMFAAALADGNSLMVGSGYRPASLQKIYFDSLANSVGEIAANQSIAKPGQSEHQTGLAVDISTASRKCYLDNCFATMADGLWLEKNSYKYGFILRYPKGKESITQYQYEPWHFRYVGIDLATAIYESGLTLDQTWPYLQTALDTLIQNRAIER